jgi:hypothetical protein
MVQRWFAIMCVCVCLVFVSVFAFVSVFLFVFVHHDSRTLFRTSFLASKQFKLPSATRNFYVDGHVPQPH